MSGLPARVYAPGDEVEGHAARLKSDMALLDTFDTSFHNYDESVDLNVVTLGLSPTRKVFLHVTASALLIDTRTEFIYSALEANESRELRTNTRESRQTADGGRRDAEQTAFKNLVTEFEKSWPRVVERAKEGAWKAQPQQQLPPSQHWLLGDVAS